MGKHFYWHNSMDNFTFHQSVLVFLILDEKAKNTIDNFLVRKDTYQKKKKRIQSDKLHKEILGQKEQAYTTCSLEDWREIKFWLKWVCRELWSQQLRKGYSHIINRSEAKCPLFPSD